MSEQKASLFERMFKGGKAKTEANTKGLETQLTERLNKLVYDEDLVKELLPVFVKLHTTEGFSKVWEVLEAKEQQIEAISGGDWFKQESDESSEQNKKEESTNGDEDPVDALLKQQYSNKE